MKHQTTYRKAKKTSVPLPAKSSQNDARMIQVMSKLEYLGIDPIALRELIMSDPLPKKLFTQKAKNERSSNSSQRLFEFAKVRLQS